MVVLYIQRSAARVKQLDDIEVTGIARPVDRRLAVVVLYIRLSAVREKQLDNSEVTIHARPADGPIAALVCAVHALRRRQPCGCLQVALPACPDEGLVVGGTLRVHPRRRGGQLVTFMVAVTFMIFVTVIALPIARARVRVRVTVIMKVRGMEMGTVGCGQR